MESKNRIKFYRFRESLGKGLCKGEDSDEDIKQHFLNKNDHDNLRVKLGDLRISFALLMSALFISSLVFIIEYSNLLLRKRTSLTKVFNINY